MSYKVMRLSIPEQNGAMLYHFPHFVQGREHGIPMWRGTLQPSDAPPLYTVKILYNNPRPPRVWVVEPPLHDNAPHRYEDGSLCLYKPLEWSWSADIYIAKTVVPWTAIWLSFYELWLEHGVWYGPEAPHNGSKLRD